MADQPSSAQGRTEQAEEQSQRARLEEAEARAARYKQLSFDDGNIILQADTASFCVHRSILSLHSEVFRDMFAVGNSDGEETRDGVPVLRLPDQDDELYELLRALYLPQHINRTIPMDFGLSLILLKMSTKYMVNFVRQEIISRLIRCYPNSIRKYRTRRVRAEDKNHILALEAALQHDVPVILPTVFLNCCQMSLDDILDGISIADGSILHFTPSTLKVILRGRQKLLDLQRLWLADFMPKFTSQLHCKEVREGLAQVFVSKSMVESFDMFAPLSGEGLCRACKHDMAREWWIMRADIWRKVPECFGLRWESAPVAARVTR
ncbi:hypothetical protein FA95DRAFT_1291470 [Auriscalpium vulgare]|uniref:Uncharacterized protein n=1 Tax=Auriscalpium vulgare TaxID=40419 RepID=A0ACB8RS73_9AGAM|nr:hypothetical protein FA95DRAFT_1291470 [Auriscalpium vulgare]